MKLLVLGNSNDDARRPPPAGLGVTLVREALAARLREGVEVVVRPAVPNPQLPAHIERLTAELDPDIVIVHVSGYLVGPVSPANRLQTLAGGRLTPLFSRVRGTARVTLGARDTATRNAARRPGPWLYRAARNRLFAAGLATPAISVPVAAAAYSAAIAHLSGREDRIVIVRGPTTWNEDPDDPFLVGGAQRRISELERRIRQACQRYRAPFISLLDELERDPRALLGSDDLHLSEHGQRLQAQRELAVLLPIVAPG